MRPQRGRERLRAERSGRIDALLAPGPQVIGIARLNIATGTRSQVVNAAPYLSAQLALQCAATLLVAVESQVPFTVFVAHRPGSKGVNVATKGDVPIGDLHVIPVV